MTGYLMNVRPLVDVTDQSLMLAVANGDVERLGVLFERYHKQLFNYLYRLTGDAQWSEDLVQEVFVRILKYRHTWQAGCGFRTWMFQIARNVRLDYAQRNPRDEISIEEQMMEFVCPLPTPDAAAERQDDMRILLEALAKLPAERREVLLLRGFQGLKFEEIAEILKCSINTIKGRAFTAIRELRAAVHHCKQEKVV
jgi:RNA polymerase sigma factor (sigma-70 family)